MEKTLILGLFLLITFNLQAQYISLHSETANVHNGKKVTVKQDIFYTLSTNNLVIHFTAPEEYIYQTNLQGEARFYYPKSNEVKLIHDPFLTAKNNLIYYFANNKVSDMGLQEGGFALTNSHNQNNLIISSWQAPTALQQYLASAELVHENFLPKYLAYYSAKGKIVKKIYYLNYQNFRNFVLPMRVVEIEYKTPQDSVIHSQTFSQVQNLYQPSNPMFQFKIPENAKVIND